MRGDLLPVRYHVYIVNGRRYSFIGAYDQHRRIVQRNAARGHEVQAIYSESTSTGKFFPRLGRQAIHEMMDTPAAAG